MIKTVNKQGIGSLHPVEMGNGYVLIYGYQEVQKNFETLKRDILDGKEAFDDGNMILRLEYHEFLSMIKYLRRVCNAMGLRDYEVRLSYDEVASGWASVYVNENHRWISILLGRKVMMECSWEQITKNLLHECLHAKMWRLLEYYKDIIADVTPSGKSTHIKEANKLEENICNDMAEVLFMTFGEIPRYNSLEDLLNEEAKLQGIVNEAKKPTCKPKSKKNK